MLATGNWFLVNAMGEEIVQGGPFTRVDPATGRLSCLDLFVVSRELKPFVSKLEIDCKQKMGIARAVKTKKKGKYKLVYSDHFPLLLTFSNLPRSEEENIEKQVKWNLAKEDGWKHYKENEDLLDKLEDVVENEETSIEETKHKFDKIHNKIKFKTFGKVTISNKDRKPSTDDEDLKENEETNAKEIKEGEKERAEKEISEIERLKRCKVGKIWELKKRIIGGKNTTTQATAIINPKTNKLAVSKEEIKSATLEYCKETLANNKPDDAFKDEITKKKVMVKDFLNLKEGEFSAKKETFYKMIAKFKSSRKRNYDFLTKSNPRFQAAVFKFCQRMFKEEVFPTDFQNTTLHMVYKNGSGGRREVLSDHRFIHCKDFWARTAEGLVIEDGLKRPLLEGSSIYQIGGQPGHRSEELVFVMKSLIAKYRRKGRLVILKLYDISKYFDKEMVEDAILVCQKRKADSKAIRLWYKLNESTQIQVKTGSGMSRFADVGAVLGQGTLGGAIISQAVLDDGVMEHFPPGGEIQLEYGDVPLAPVMFQDDLADCSGNIENARIANQRVDILTKQRGLELNKDKTVCIIIGSKKQKQEATKQLTDNPLFCGSFVMKEKQVDKWLGQYLSSKGLADSVAETVAAREGKVRGACLEIAHIVNDWRSQCAGGLVTAITLWEACCVPSLLHGAGTWTEISPETVRRLNTIQQWFWRLILQVGPGAPLASLAWDTASLDMKLRVWMEKLMLILHFRSLEDGALAHRIYREQRGEDWPGLVSEAEQICTELKVESVNLTRCNKKEYRKIVFEACHLQNEKILREMADGKEKCARMNEEKYGRKEYTQLKSISEVRIWYRTRFGQRPFAGNFSKDKQYAKTNWLCKCGMIKEKESHIIAGKCPVYDDIRGKFSSLERDEDLVDYFNQVLARRDKLEDLEQEERDSM